MMGRPNYSMLTCLGVYPWDRRSQWSSLSSSHERFEHMSAVLSQTVISDGAGAPERILDRCSTISLNGQVRRTEMARQRTLSTVQQSTSCNDGWTHSNICCVDFFNIWRESQTDDTWMIIRILAKENATSLVVSLSILYPVESVCCIEGRVWPSLWVVMTSY